MAGLKRLVGVTLAVILVTALVIFVLRPSANTTTSTVQKPGTPTDQPTPGICSGLSRGLERSDCGSSNGHGSDNDTDDHNATGDHSDDHEGSDHDGHEGSDGDHDANDDHGDHSDSAHGEVEEDD